MSAGEPIRPKPAFRDLAARTSLASLALLVCWAVCWAFASPAHASPPTHKPLPDPIAGLPLLNHACGTATDSHGDIYVANSGSGAVEVFNPSGSHLATVADSNGPCALATDTNGNLYVTNTATGNVVKFTPNAYPLTASPTWGAPSTIDSSGQARGISVDPADDRLYVAEGDHIAAYNSNGSSAATIGSGDLTAATGVTAWTHPGPVHDDHYVSAADSSGDLVKVFTGTDITALSLRRTIDGSTTPDGSFGFGSAGAYLGLDPFTGHLFVYDNAHTVLDEFEATGQYFTQVHDPGFADAQPTAIAVDRSTGTHDGDIYVSAGASAGAKLLAFAPATTPSRPPYVAPRRAALPGLSHHALSSRGVAVDSHGDVYLAAGPTIQVFNSAGVLLTSISDANNPADLTVDSAGNLYVLDSTAGPSGKGVVVRYTPDAYPLTGSPSYAAPVAVDVGTSTLTAVGLNAANDRLFVVSLDHRIAEYDSAGNGLLDANFAAVDPNSFPVDIEGYAANGDLYLLKASRVEILDPSGTQILSTPVSFADLTAHALAVDQSSGDLALDEVTSTGQIADYEPSGSLIDQFGAFAAVAGPTNVAIDSSGGPNNGNLYLAYRDDLTAFAPRSYGDPPTVVTGLASGVGSGAATLNGTVNPRGFAVSGCHFDYETEATYITDGNTFASATSVPCAETPAQIGSGLAPVSVHADLTGLDLSQRYRFRLVATNTFGTGNGAPGILGPPLVTAKAASPVAYTEATLNANLDPSGLATSYHFEYGDQGPCTSSPCTSSPTEQLAPGAGPTDLQLPLTGLAEGTPYHFRLVASNPAGPIDGADRSFTTLAHLPSTDCPNAALRSGPSANLPDCRAYELTTPPDTGGWGLHAAGVSGLMFNNWLAAPGGGSLVFYADGTLPGFDGNGVLDGYRSLRTAGGWQTELFGPSYAQAPGGADQHGVSADGGYSLWKTFGDGTLGTGNYLRTPAGFQLLGQGSLATDPGATLDVSGGFVSPSAAHVIFSSSARLEPAAPPAGTAAVYDRSPGGPTHVVSLLPDSACATPPCTPAAGQNAQYQGASADGTAIAFKFGGDPLYVRVGNAATYLVTSASGARFAGLTDDGSRLFYDLGGDLFSFSTATQQTTQITTGATAQFANVSADGSRVYFLSTQQLDPPDGTLGADNLYLWDGSQVRFLATLDPADLSNVEESPVSWVRGLGIGSSLNGGITGRGNDVTRSTPDGGTFVFQSHADLAGADTQGHWQIYRYDAAGQQLLCISCPPDGSPAGADARLQTFRTGAPANRATLVPSVTDDGRRVFFDTEAALLPEDTNGHLDVYEWLAQGTGGCARPGGCLALISTGRAASDSFLYGMTPDGHDVYIYTFERLLSADDPGSPSFYDARVDGGFPASTPPPGCIGDACQGNPTPPPATPPSGSSGYSGPANQGKDRSPATAPPTKHCKKKHGRRRCKARHRHGGGK